MERTAYMQHLINNADQYPGQELNAIAAFIRQDATVDHNPQAWDLLHATGDKGYSMETFDKAAKLVMESV